jgi:rhodanese-related sulfurtransferase
MDILFQSQVSAIYLHNLCFMDYTQFMKYITAIFTAFSISLLALPVGAFESIAPSADELKAMDVLLIDIREPHEWQETGIVEGAIPITASRLFLQELAPLLDDRPVALICRTGNRTEQLSGLLEPHLQQEVINIEGGIFRLMAEGYQPIPLE